MNLRRIRSRAVFLAAPARSGSTAVMRALAAHPAVFAAGAEGPFIHRAGRIAWEWARSEKSDYYTRSLRPSAPYFLDRLAALAFETVAGEGEGGKLVRARALKGDFSLRRARAWAVKAFPDREEAEGLSILFPEAKFVFLVRRGVEAVHSRTKFPTFRDGTFEEQCRTWAESIHRFAFLLGHPAAMLVRQEELLADPAAFFTRLFRFLDLPDDPRPAEFCRSNLVHPLSEADRAGVSAAEALAARPAPEAGWPPEARAIFHERCGEAMALLGYEVPFPRPAS